jgi:hypothetical protein
MAITYTYKLKALQTATERINKQEFPHTIRAIIWDLTATDENGVSKSLDDITTFLNFKTRNTGSFISYSNLSEDDVIGFIKKVENIDSHKVVLQELFEVTPSAEPESRATSIMPWYFNGKTSFSGSRI